MNKLLKSKNMTCVNVKLISSICYNKPEDRFQTCIHEHIDLPAKIKCVIFSEGSGYQGAVTAKVTRMETFSHFLMDSKSFSFCD